MSKLSLYSPHAKQKEIHEACMLENPAFFVICCMGRRFGKSMLAINQALFWALKYPKSKIWYVCPTDQQTEVVLNEMWQAIKDSNIVKSKKNSKGSREVIFNNGTTLQFKSAQSGNNLRGNLVNFIDEAAYLDNSIFEAAIMPTLAVGGKKVLIISTPKGKNWFYKYFLKGTDKRSVTYQSFRGLSTDNPMANKELIQMFKESVPEAIFRQEYLGSFEDSAAVFKNVEELCNLKQQKEPIEDVRYFAGIDIGMLHDDTVITIFDKDANMVYMDKFTGLESPELLERLLKTISKWKPFKTLIETNNQGLLVYQQLKRNWSNIEEFTTTNSTKEEIINQLVAAFSSKTIRCLNDDELILQLNSFIFELTKTGKIRYTAASGFHDDIVMSMAIAYSAVYSANYRVSNFDYITGPHQQNPKFRL
jgi:phage FluMu gp28-like protein